MNYNFIMKKISLKIVFYIAAFLFCSLILSQESHIDNFEKGKIIENVACKGDREQSYAVYLPTGYSKEKLWPVLFAFDPAARAKVPLELFKAAAEKYHYIVICSNNVRNGPWEIIIKAIKALWLDTGKRFFIDYDRIYTTGFSGGARAAAAFPHVVGRPVAGIIACGAGLPSTLKAEQVKPSFYYGIVGLEDFNYKEFVRLGKEFSRAGVNHTIDLIDGPHNWPPAEVCIRAIEWMEIEAIKRGIKRRDSRLIDTIYQKTLKVGQNLEDSGKIYFAAGYYRSVETLFTGLKETSGIRKTAARLEQSEEFKDFARVEKLRNAKERDFINRFAFVFSLVRNTEPGQLKLKKILKDLQLDFLLKEAGRTGNVYDSAMAKRLLAELRINGNTEGTKYIERSATATDDVKKRDSSQNKHRFKTRSSSKKSPDGSATEANDANKKERKRAYVFFEIAARAGKSDPIAFYNLACCYALDNKKKEALKNLRTFAELALKKGYRNFAFIKTDKQLDNLRKEKEFLAILKLLPPF